MSQDLGKRHGFETEGRREQIHERQNFLDEKEEAVEQVHKCWPLGFDKIIYFTKSENSNMKFGT